MLPRVRAMTDVHAAFFLGQGGYVFSMPWYEISQQVKALGIDVAVYSYSDYLTALNICKDAIMQGAKVALCGYSLGGSTSSYLQTLLPVDLVVNVALSTLAENYQIVETTKRSRLFYSTDFLSSGGQHDGYTETTLVEVAFGIPVATHLSVPATDIVKNGVLLELAALKGK